MPAVIAQQTITRGPSPGKKTKSGYPRQYRNEEGHGETKRHNFDTREEYGGLGQLHEYPVKSSEGTPFDYDRGTARAKQVEQPIHPNDRARVAQKPYNDASTFRAVSNESGNLVGVTCHPKGNRRGHERAYCEPLDKEGRRKVSRYKDANGHAKTYPLR